MKDFSLTGDFKLIGFHVTYTPLRDTLPISRPGNYKKYPVYKLTVPGLQVGDVLDVTADIQVTNELPNDDQVGVSSELTLGDTSISPRGGENVLRRKHHHRVTEFACFQVAKIEQVKQPVRLMLWAYNRVGKELLVDGYGSMIVRHWRTH